MRAVIMCLAIAATALGAPSLGHADVKDAKDAKAADKPAKPEPSASLKAYKGPEGQVVIMVEANDGKEMLVHFKNVSKELDGTTVLYLFEDLGNGDKNVYVNKKRGSKTYRSNLLSCRDNRWEFYHPGKPNITFAIRYSEFESEKFKVEDILNAYKP